MKTQFKIVQAKKTPRGFTFEVPGYGKVEAETFTHSRNRFGGCGHMDVFMNENDEIQSECELYYDQAIPMITDLVKVVAEGLDVDTSYLLSEVKRELSKDTVMGKIRDHVYKLVISDGGYEGEHF